MANLPAYGRNEAAVTAREAQTPLADFDGGLNLGASNAPGVGICTNVPNPKLSDWTLEDQNAAARTPQETQHIGANGIEDGSTTNPSYPVQLARYNVTPGVDDINNTAHFIEATQQALPGASLGGTLFNMSDQTVEIGDRIWAMDEVA